MRLYQRTRKRERERAREMKQWYQRRVREWSNFISMPSSALLFDFGTKGARLIFFLSLITLTRFLFFLRGPPQEPRYTISHVPFYRFVVDLILTFLFIGVHSSLFANCTRQYFSQTRFAFFHRSGYLILSTLTLELLISFWHPCGLVWFLPRLSSLFNFLSCIAVVMLIMSLVSYSPYELFGTEIRPTLTPELEDLYSHMRHPLILGICVLFFANPIFTYDKCALAVIFCLFIFLSSELDEKDLSFIETKHNTNLRRYLSMIENNWRIVVNRRPIKI
eukprot:TRINITY_DN2092_c0_g1_i7.p1 TRINITY_DN2092_c0_g1~~TRINITY_DN2092_c0_g1_i7.p1  ORF type:complete len:277 (+),score=39.97 TRINITY_DN2092_c0_g1_i7:550-1380(+)